MAEVPSAAWRELREALHRLESRISALEVAFAEGQAAAPSFAESEADGVPREEVPLEEVTSTVAASTSLPGSAEPVQPRTATPLTMADIESQMRRAASIENQEASSRTTTRPGDRFSAFDFSGETWESLVGGRGLTYLGGASLALAVAFFVPWAWQHFQMPAAMRVAIFHLCGIGILAAAWWILRKELPVLAHGLAGLGIFTLYSSAFAMEYLYQLWGDSGWWVMLLDCAWITALAIAIAVRYSSVYIIVLGAIGGYLTPLVAVQQGEGFVTIFCYLAFLNLALVTTAVLRGWSFLKPLGLVATVVMFIAWIPTRDNVWQTEWMLILHGLLFLAAATAPPIFWQIRTTTPDLTVLIANSFWFVGATWLLFHDRPEQQMAMVCWSMSAIHLSLFALTYKRVTHADRMPRYHLGLALAFFTLAVPLQMRDTLEYLAYAWAVEAFVFVAIGVYFRDRQMATGGGAVFGLAMLRALAFDYLDAPSMIGTSPIDRRMLVLVGTGLVTLAGGSCYWWVNRISPYQNLDKLPYKEGGVLIGLGNLVAMLGFTCQWDGRIVLVIWTCVTALFWVAAFLARREAAYYYALFLSLAMVGGRAVYHGVSYSFPFELLSNSRFLSLLLVAALYFVVSYSLRHRQSLLLGASQKRREAEGRELRLYGGGLLHLCANVALLFAISCEIHNWFHPTDASFRSRVSLDEQVTYSVVWAIYAGVLVAVGFLLKYSLARVVGLAGFLLVAAKVFFIDLSNLPLLLRVLALSALGVMLLITSFWYQQFTARLSQSD